MGRAMGFKEGDILIQCFENNYDPDHSKTLLTAATQNNAIVSYTKIA